MSLLIKATVKIFITVTLIISLSLPAHADNNVYRNVNNENMQIALTFDDGPHPGRTPEILDILEKYNIKATFFVIGENVNYYPEVFQRIVAEGHEIGNHTYSHKVLTDCNEKDLKEEIELFNKALENYEPKPILNIRPPEGGYGNCLKEFASLNDYNIVLWSVDTMDWAHRSVENIVETVLSETSGGDIILMHDFISGKSPTPDALEIIIPKLIERGFEFVTVSELIK